MSTKSMLINFVGYPNEAFNLVPDNGLANLAACLLRAGHETMIWDCSTVKMMEELYPYHEKDELKQLTQTIIARIRDRKKPEEADLKAFYALEGRIDRYQDEKTRELGKKMGEYAKRNTLDFVGFKLWSGAGFHGSIILAEEIRKLNPSVKIFGGGPHVDMFMHRSFEVTDTFDVLAAGEGEDVIVQLAEYAEEKRDLADVSNAIYLNDGRPVRNPEIRVEDMDSLPLPCYDEDVYPAMEGDEKIKVILLDESRGCPNDCNFCIHPIKSGRRRRTATASSFVDKLEQVIERHGFHTFRFAGSNPPVRLRREIATEILRRGLQVSFSGFAHIRGAEQEDFRFLKAAGCVALSFGVESGSQRILDEAMNKRIRVEDIRRTFTRCREAGIGTLASVIVPAPGDTEKTKEETYRLLCETKPDATLVSFPIMVFGSAWEREKKRFGFEVSDAEFLYRKGMTYRMKAFAPAVLWRPVGGFSLDGKSFRHLCQETAEFVQRLDKAGLATQFLDHIFLMAGPAGMPAVQLGKLLAKYMVDGEVDELRKFTRRINRNVLGGVRLMAVQ